MRMYTMMNQNDADSNLIKMKCIGSLQTRARIVVQWFGKLNPIQFLSQRRMQM